MTTQTIEQCIELLIERVRAEGRIWLYAQCTICAYDKIVAEEGAGRRGERQITIEEKALRTVALLALMVTILWLLTGRP